MAKRIKQKVIRLFLTVGVFLAAGFGTTGQCGESMKRVLLSAMDWKPVYGPSLPEGGVFTALTREAFQRSGYIFEIAFVPWARAVEMARVGQYDGVMGAMMTPGRRRSFTASEMIMPLEVYLFSRAEETITYEALDDLKGFSIGVIAGSASAEMLGTAGLRLQRVGTFDQNLRKLIQGRIDLMEGEKYAMAELLNKYPEYRDRIKRVNPPITVSPLYVIISMANPDHLLIVADFNRGLREMRADGTFDAIIRRHGFDRLQ